MRTLVVSVMSVVLGLCLFPVLIEPVDHHPPQKQRAAAMSTKLIEAMHRYHKEYGRWASGSHAEVIRALRGDNEKGIVFLEVPDEQLNENEELRDPWGTPYRLSVDPKTQRARVHSAGPDGKFQDVVIRSDDHVSHWSAGTTGIPGLPF